MGLRHAFCRLVQASIFLGMLGWSWSSWGLPANMIPGYVYTVAGEGTPGLSGDGGPAIQARISGAQGIAVDDNGNLYIAEFFNRRVRKVTPGGIISTVPGLDNNQPLDVAVDNAGNLYVADYGNNNVRKVAIDGTVTTVAGNGTRSLSIDGGPATSSAVTPTAVAIDKAGNLYIADGWNYRIRKVTDGVITTVAGNGTTGYSGDEGPATSAMIGTVTSMAIDSAGNLFISDRDFNRIRKVANGIITTVAGTGSVGSDKDIGIATDATIMSPTGIAIDKFDNLYIVSSNYFRRKLIRKLSNGIIINVVTGDGSSSSDGQPANTAAIYEPRGIAIDETGNLYFAQYQTNPSEADNSRVRVVATTAPISILGLSIVCPTTVAKGGSAACSSAVIYSDGSSKPTSANWDSSDPAAATMNGNTLTVSNVTSDSLVTISASYTENGVTKTARQAVMISSHNYKVTDLVPLEGVYSLATGINNKGEVIGYTGQHAFVYSNGNLINLGLLFSFRDSAGVVQTPTHANAINDLGQVVGFWNGTSGFSFLYSNGTMSTLRNLDGSSGLAYGINNNSQIVGYMSVPNTAHAFLYDNGSFKDLGALGQNNASIGYSSDYRSYAHGINDSGQVVGYFYGPSGGTRAFLYSNGSMTDIGSLGFGSCGAGAINNNGQITGTCYVGNARHHAYLYSNGSMTDLGTLDEVTIFARGMNNKGEIVGDMTTDHRTYRAFLYSNGKMRYLDDLVPPGSGWTFASAWGINDAGQIVGGGTYEGRDINRYPVQGTVHGKFAFLLTPQSIDSVTLSTTNLSLIEGGNSGAYTVTLGNAPSADVTVTVSPDNQLSASPAQLTFTAANWNTPQTVTVQAIQDGIAEGSHTGAISHTTASADPAYNALAVGTVTVSITEIVIPTVSVAAPSGAIWTQSDLPVTGTAAPGAAVTLTVTNLSTNEVRAVSALAGADGNWSATLSGLSDGDYELLPEAGGITGGKVTVAVDSHAPVGTLSVTSNNGPGANGWYTGPVNLALTATDGVGGSGVERSEHTLDGGAWTSFPATGLTLSADGNYTVCHRSVDKAGNVEAARCVPIPIDATAPSVNPVFDAVGNTLNLNAQDAVSGIAGIEISRDGGQTWIAQSGPIGFKRDGTYVVQYRVRDNAGNLATGQTTVTVVTIPAITVPADQNALEAASENFNLGSFSDQVADNPWNVDIDWGDGSTHDIFTLNAPGALGSLPHAYLDNGSYTVTIKVTDQAGNTGSKSFKITVANVAPTATFTATAGPLNEGSAATLTFSNPADQSPIDTQAGFSYAFDCGDGAGYGAAGTVNSMTCAALDNPNQIVKGRVLDKDGGATEYSAVIAINNVPPTLGVIAGPSTPVQRDTPATITVDFTDPGVRDTHTAMIDWDDGTMSAGTVTETGGSGSISASHSYSKPGHYIVTLTVMDKDGGSASAIYKAIQVKGGPPVK